jgi:hypothetical protein
MKIIIYLNEERTSTHIVTPSPEFFNKKETGGKMYPQEVAISKLVNGLYPNNKGFAKRNYGYRIIS